MFEVDPGRVDMRSHLAALDDRGLLVAIDQEVDPATEAAWLMRDLETRGLAGHFASIAGSAFPLVYNSLGSREMLAVALDCTADDVEATFQKRRPNLIQPEREDGTARSQEVVLRGDDADLDVLPLVTHSELDDGGYITAGLVICHDPETGLRNVSVNRIHPVGPTDGAIRMMSPQQLGQIHDKSEALGNDLPIAIAIGMHPTASLAAATSPPLGVDELAIAGALRGAPVPMVPGVSIPIDVPAEAEIVIEAWVRAGVREPEGPFGDFMDYYVPRLPNHRFYVTAITHRRSAVYHTMHAGSQEDVHILGLSRASDIHEAVTATGARVSAVRLQPTILGAVISIDPRYDGEAKTVAMAAFGSYRWLKYCIVVDADVDIDDPSDVWWAIATRADATNDVVTIPKSGGFPRDEGGMHTSKLMIDATVPVGADPMTFRRRRPPGRGPLRLEEFMTQIGGTA